MNDAINILLKGYKQIDMNNIPNISGIYLFRNKITLSKKCISHMQFFKT